MKLSRIILLCALAGGLCSHGTAQIFTTVHQFAAGGHASGYYTNSDGANPSGGMVLSGNTLFGTTVYGAAGKGTVFAVNTNGNNFGIMHLTEVT